MTAEAPTPPPGAATGAGAAGLGDTLHALGDQSKQSVRAALATGQALRALLAADLALARAALGRTLVFAVAASALAISTWLLLMAALVAGLRALGLPRAAALLLAALLGAVGAVVFGLAARRSLDDAGLQASRRQLARLFPEDDAGAGVDAAPGQEPPP